MVKVIFENYKNKGFSLPELMVALLVAAILMSIAISVYIQARNRAVVRTAQVRLKEVVGAAKELHGGGNSTTVTGQESGIEYESLSTSDLNSELDTISVVASGSQSGDDVGIATDTPSGGVSFATSDANGTSHTAAITSTGTVTIN